MGSLQKIDHIVVLMLENRSFDSLLGTLYPKSDSFEGLTGNEQNPDASGTCSCSATPCQRRVRDLPWTALSKIISPNSN